MPAAVLLVILCARLMAQLHFASVLALAREVMSSSAQVIVDDIVFTEFVCVACLVGECSALSFVLEVARHVRLCWHGGWCCLVGWWVVTCKVGKSTVPIG